MGIHNTNARTAIDGILQPLAEGELSEGPARHTAPETANTTPRQGKKRQANRASEIDEITFRPRHRPPIPQLLVVDDSQRTAEIIRIRKSPFRIGRVEGDLVISLDSQLSASHAKLYLKDVQGRLQWYLKDLLSTNGTYVLVTRVLLNPNRAILIGGVRFRFELATSPVAPTVDRTQLPTSKATAATEFPCLIPLDQDRDAQRLVLSKTEQWIGSDPKQCSLVFDDASISPRHVRVYRDVKGRWQAECLDVIKGLWSQIDEVFLDRAASFQCGEQRFQFKLD